MVHCRLCGKSSRTETLSAHQGWTKLVITVGRITPRPGTVYLCTSCWPILNQHLQVK